MTLTSVQAIVFLIQLHGSRRQQPQTNHYTARWTQLTSPSDDRAMGEVGVQAAFGPVQCVQCVQSDMQTLSSQIAMQSFPWEISVPSRIGQADNSAIFLLTSRKARWPRAWAQVVVLLLEVADLAMATRHVHRE